MSENEIITENHNGTDGIRPLIVSDSETVQRFCAPLRHLLFGFEAQSVSSCVVVPPNSQIESFLWPGIEIIEHPALRFPLFYRQNRKILVSRIDKFKPTIVHCLGTARAQLAKTISQIFNIPAVVTINSSKQNFLRRQIVSTGFSTVIAPSERIAEVFKKQNSKIAAMVKQVNIGTFVDETCACFSRPERIGSMVMVCDFLRFDDLEPLLGAVRHLAIDGYEFLVVLMGSGPAEKEIRKFIRSVGLANTVNISPEVRPMKEVFRGADVFIQPYVTERLDPALIEAASAGTVIATDKNNADNFLQNNATAIFFDSKDELSIYSTLQKLLDDKQLARTLAVGAQNYLRSNNTVSAMVDQLLEIYKEATTKNKEL
jgi:glycosyltransferase involved in cell wall biosynthesis